VCNNSAVVVVFKGPEPGVWYAAKLHIGLYVTGT
jgi:hypothetical protein